MKKYLLPSILILFLIFTLVGNCAWLSGYDQRIKLTIDNTKIDAALSDFPVTIFFTPTQGEEIFTEFDADSDYMKCAFTSSDGTTQLYAEKEIAFFSSQYPPAQSDTYVKSTTKFGTTYWAYYATDPTKSLTGGASANSWYAVSGTNTNQRFHIDLGSAKIVKRIYYENYHDSGGTTNAGVQNFTFWGSNTGAGTFDDLVYANDEGWTQLTISQSTFDEHTGSDVADPKYIKVTNTTAYRYYAFKFADAHGYATMGVRRIELQAGGAIYHVKVTSISSSADTDIYYYYDNDHADNTTYIGAINTAAGATVWDANFSAVYHMVDATTSTVVDSTSNNIDGTKTSANNPLESVAQIGKGQTFSSDSISTSGAYNDNGFTISLCVKPSDVTTTIFITNGQVLASPDNKRCVIVGAQDDYFNIYNNAYPTGTDTDTQIAATVDTWQHISYGSDGTDVLGYKNGANVIDVTANLNCADMDAYFLGQNSTGSVYYAGIMDEVRISDTLRTAAWDKGTYNSLWDTLLTYGSEEGVPVAVNVINFGANF